MSKKYINRISVKLYTGLFLSVLTLAAPCYKHFSKPSSYVSSNTDQECGCPVSLKELESKTSSRNDEGRE